MDRRRRHIGDALVAMVVSRPHGRRVSATRIICGSLWLVVILCASDIASLNEQSQLVLCFVDVMNWLWFVIGFSVFVENRAVMCGDTSRASGGGLFRFDNITAD
jgi:hypothetical protein